MTQSTFVHHFDRQIAPAGLILFQRPPVERGHSCLHTPTVRGLAALDPAVFLVWRRAGSGRA